MAYTVLTAVCKRVPLAGVVILGAVLIGWWATPYLTMVAVVAAASEHLYAAMHRRAIETENADLRQTGEFVAILQGAAPAPIVSPRRASTPMPSPAPVVVAPLRAEPTEDTAPLTRPRPGTMYRTVILTDLDERATPDAAAPWHGSTAVMTRPRAPYMARHEASTGDLRRQLAAGWRIPRADWDAAHRRWFDEPASAAA